MVNVNNPTVTINELQRFVTVVTAEIDSQPLDPEHDALVITAGDRGTVAMFASRGPDHPSSTAQIDQLLARRRRMVAMVSLTRFAPDETTPPSLAWVLVAVGRGGGPPLVAARRIVEDDQWTQAQVAAVSLL